MHALIKETPTQNENSASLPDGRHADASDPFSRLAGCVSHLPVEIQDQLTPLLAHFRVKTFRASLRKTGELLDCVLRTTSQRCDSEQAGRVRETVERIQSGVRTCAEFAERLRDERYLGASRWFLESAIKEFLVALPAAVKNHTVLLKELNRATPTHRTLREVNKEIESSIEVGKQPPKIVGSDHLEPESSPLLDLTPALGFTPHSGSVREVASVLSVESGLRPSSLLLVTSHEVVGKDGEIYRLELPSETAVVTARSDQPVALSLGYHHHNGLAVTGTIPGFVSQGEPAAGSLLKIDYHREEAVSPIDSGVLDEVVRVSGARTALPSFLADLIEITRDLLQTERVQVLSSAFFERAYVYSKDESLLLLISKIPQNLRLSFLAGLRVGTCETMSYELQNYLTLAGIPAVVEGGPIFDEDTNSFSTPGHARVRCLTDPPLVIDPTRWTKRDLTITPLSDKLLTESLQEIRGMGPIEAFQLGERLRSKLVVPKEERDGTDDNTQAGRTQGHQLLDDFDRRPLISYRWSIEENMRLLGEWSELIPEEIQNGSDAFFGKFYCNKETEALLEQAHQPILSGRSTTFIDWLVAHLHNPKTRGTVGHPLSCYFDPRYEGAWDPGNNGGFTENVWATFIFLAEHLLNVGQAGDTGDGRFNGNYVRSFLFSFVAQPEAAERSARLESLFIRVITKTISDWLEDLQVSSREDEKFAFVSFTQRLIEMSDAYTPSAAKQLKLFIADSLKSAKSTVLTSFLAGRRADDDRTEDKDVCETHSICRLTAPVRAFVEEFFQTELNFAGFSTRAFDVCASFLNSAFREAALRSFSNRICHLAAAQHGRSHAELYTDCIGVSARDPFWLNLGISVGSFSLLDANGLFGTREAFIAFSESSEFKEAMRNSSLDALKELVENFNSLADNVPESRRHELAPLFTSLVRQLCEEFNVTLPAYDEGAISALNAILPVCPTPRSPTLHSLTVGLAESLAELSNRGLLNTTQLSRFSAPLSDAVIAEAFTSFLSELDGRVATSSTKGLLQHLVARCGGSLPIAEKSLAPILLLSLASRKIRLAPQLARVVRFASSTVSEGDRELLKIVETHAPKAYKKALGTLRHDLFAPYVARLVVATLGVERCHNVIKYAFLRSLADQKLHDSSALESTIIHEAVRHFFPSVKSPEGIEDLAKFFYALTELNSEKKIPSHLAMSENPFTSEELHQRIRELCTAHSITARVALSKLVDDTKQSASDVAADATPTFTLNWRKVLGRYAGSRHQRRTVRTILGSPTPPEVRTLSVYTPGDDLRRVDWKASAKSDRLFVREFENFSPIESKSVGILIDWSDMGYYSETSGQIVNGEFIHKVVAFVRSMIADGKVPSVTLLSYGVPDLFIEGSEVRRLFGDATSPLLFNLTRMAARAAASAAMYGLNEQVARAAPTLAPEAEGQILAKCTGARRQMLLLVTNMPGGPLQSMSPSTPIWTDSFSYHLVKRGDAVRVEL